jgi:hypothetical protein
MKSKTLFTLAMLCFTLTSIAFAQQTDDREAMRQAVLDYVEGIYEVQPERIERSVSRELAKVGYWREKDGKWLIMNVLWQSHPPQAAK